MMATLSVRHAFVTRLLSIFGSRAHQPRTGTPIAAAPARMPKPGVARASRLAFERIFARERRMDAVPGPATASLPPSALMADDQIPRPSAFPISMPHQDALVLHRNPATSPRREDMRSVQTAATKPVAAAPDASGSRGTSPVPQPGSPVPLSPGELGRLTDEVVRAIDRRIVAQRERKGVI
jgi:hypothetical protein